MADYEIIKMKQLAIQMQYRLAGLNFAGFAFAYLLSFPVLKLPYAFTAISRQIRIPFAFTFGAYFSMKLQEYPFSSRFYHDLMVQPAPYGGYMRKTVKNHFPVAWYYTSSHLHELGYSLPEMNEYDKSTQIPETHTTFDDTFF